MDEEIQQTPGAQSPAHTGCSETMRAELLDQCEEQFGLLQKLQNEIILADTESGDGETSEAMNRLNAIMLELEQWQEMEPKLLSTNPEILLTLGKEELQRLNNQLKMVLSCSQAKQDSLRDLLQREQAWLKEKEEVLSAVTERVSTLRDENERLSEHSILQDMKRKITKVKDYHGNLMETLSDMLAEHFPLPSQQLVGTKKKRGAAAVSGTALISLSEILEKLTNKTLETPHEPYVIIEDSFWPPYIEMLLRNGIAVRHPEDCSKIRLENFY
ncbi:centromere protein K isoform X1 [Electrophorus electricus]|uniref:Centromere protein K n=1 Tax=Electrophorus electricus TaxID=8005 RepID=A0A4W4FSY4_ELEEL|nr:centromere protein K isoform X1 [Electrophorus electricus]XP_026865791.2 centromere protein K isoform X1 [Electrophorus electricus]